MVGFTGEMKLVTLGRGLMSLSDLGDLTVDALYPNVGTVRTSATKAGFGPTVKLLIHSEDGSGQDISIDCHPDQLFELRDGSYCKARNLKSKRLVSIGQNKVYCSDVHQNFEPSVLYVPIKMQCTYRDNCFINGISVKFGNRF